MTTTERTRYAGEYGATAVEYALLISLIAAVIAGAVFIFGGEVLGLYERVCPAFGGC